MLGFEHYGRVTELLHKAVFSLNSYCVSVVTTE